MSIKIEFPQKNSNNTLKNVGVIYINGMSYVYELATLEIVGIEADDERAIAARQFIQSKERDRKEN